MIFTYYSIKRIKWLNKKILTFSRSKSMVKIVGTYNFELIWSTKLIFIQ
jgi:hypothetical protein